MLNVSCPWFCSTERPGAAECRVREARGVGSGVGPRGGKGAGALLCLGLPGVRAAVRRGLQQGRGYEGVPKSAPCIVTAGSTPLCLQTVSVMYVLRFS